MEFTEWLQQQLDMRDWDHAELARRSGLTKGGISHVMSGDRQAGVDFCIAMARALGVPREEVFRARGWLLREPETVIIEADPRLVGMAEAVKVLPFEQRERILNAWEATLVAVGVAYEVKSVAQPERPPWQRPPEEVAKFPAWKRALYYMMESMTLLSMKGRANDLARRSEAFQAALDNGRNPVVLIDKVMEVGDKLDIFNTKEERTAYLKELREDDLDVYEVVSELVNHDGRLQIPELA